MERDSIIFYKSWADATLHLPAQERGELLTAIIDYAVYGKKPSELNGTSHAVFTIVKPLIDANNKRYVNGKRGGSKNGVSNNPFGRGGKTTEKLPMVDNLTTDGNLKETTKELPNNKCNTLNVKCKTLNELSNDNNLSIEQVNAMSIAKTIDAQSPDKKKARNEEKRVAVTDTAKEIVAYYNTEIEAKGARLRRCITKSITAQRMNAICARVTEYGEDNVRTAINKAVASRFLNYDASNAPVGIDWIMRPNNFPKVLEGNYDNKERAPRDGNNGSMGGDRYTGMIHVQGDTDPDVWRRDKEMMKKYKR